MVVDGNPVTQERMAAIHAEATKLVDLALQRQQGQ